MTQKASANSSAVSKTVHVFKSGVHVSNSGSKFTFSDAEIAAIAKIYDPAIHQAPIVIGHPTLDAPAWGWVDKLNSVGSDLFATESKVDPTFAEMRTAGRYDKRSIALYAPDDVGNPTPGAWYLKHVGYLGAVPPAVKGLQDAAFADASAATVIFSEPIEPIEPAANTATDPINPEPVIAYLPNPNPNHKPTQPVSVNPNLPKELPMTPEQIAELKAKADRADAAEAEVTTLKAAAVQSARAAFAEKRTAEATEFVTSQIKRGVLKPEHKERVVALLAQEPQKVEFAESGTTVSSDAAQIVRDVLAGAVSPVEFGECVAGKPPAATVGSDAELHAKATQIAKEKGITFEAALRTLC